MIKVQINKICAKLVECEPLIAGMIGKTLEVEFSADWNGLNKTAVFSNGDTVIDVLESQWNGNTITIPHEVLTDPNRIVNFGIYGYTMSGDDIILAIPTLYTSLGRVYLGTNPSGDESTEPSLPVYAQLQWEIDHFEVPEEQIATQVQEYLDEHPIEIQPATETVLGGIKVGNGLSVTADGTLSADAPDLDGYATEQWVEDKGYLTEHQSLAGYATESYVQNYHDNTKQDVITDLASIRSGAALGATALQSVPNTYRTAAAQDVIDSGKQPVGDYALRSELFSGNYNDLTNKPTIPTVNDAVLTIKQGGVTKGTFSANASSATEINLDAGGGGGGSDGVYIVHITLANGEYQFAFNESWDAIYDALYDSDKAVVAEVWDADDNDEQYVYSFCGYSEIRDAGRLRFAFSRAEGNKIRYLYVHDNNTITAEVVDLDDYALKSDIGELSDLDTEAKNNLVAAINEVKQSVSPTVTVEPANDDIPRLFVWGNTLPITKTDTDFEFRYISDTADFSGYCTLKCQGNSSMSYAKKNFTIKLFSDSTHETKLKKDFKGWGKENKFVLKANFIDHSHSRNIVCANLWSELVGIRSNYASLPERYRNSPKHGAIDGFPIKLYANGTYQGIYTWNIPKDKWMADMDDDLETDCILCGENYVGGCFRGAWGGTESTGWTDELHDTAPQSIITRWNEVITFVRTSSDAEFRANLSDYFDVESLIDYYLFGIYTTGLDAFGKNQLYFTYDGTHWIAGMYDMDSTIGLWWNGQSFVASDYARSEFQDYKDGDGNLLYERLEGLFISEIKARKEVIRQSVITEPNMDSKFENWWYRIGTELLTEDGDMWNAPSKTTNNVTQIRNYVRDRLAYTDGYIESLVTPIPCTSISLDQSSISFSDNTPQTLTATVTPDNTTDIVVWSSDNTSIATVVGGVVTPNANGNCTITATCGDYSATCAVSVSMSQDIPCTSISLNKSTLAFGTIGSSQTLVATPVPNNTTDAVIWSTSNQSVATVVNGVVTSVANGNCTITVTCGSQTATCTITVEEIGNPLANVTWYDNQVFDGVTGELKTTSGEHASSKFTLDDGPWTLNLNDSNCKYATVYCWDSDGKFQLRYNEIANASTSMTFVAIAGYQYAVKFYGTGDRTKLSMDKQTVTEPANPLTINLSELTWSLSGNVNAGIGATIPSIPAPINTVKLNYPVDWYSGGSALNTTGPTSMTDTSLHFTFVGPSNLYCRCFGTTAEAISAAQTYFTENNSQIIINGE